MAIETQEQFSEALGLLLANDDTRRDTLEKLMQVSPGNPNVELAYQYEVNLPFREWLNARMWALVSDADPRR